MCDDADHHTYESFMEAWVSPQVVGAYVTTAPPPHYKRLRCMMVKLMHHNSSVMSKYTAEQGQILAAKADTHTC